MIVKVVLALIVVVNAVFALTFIKDLIAHKEEAKAEPGNPVAQAVSAFVIFFFSTLGISDFAISASVYPKLKWVDDKKLPGTMNAQCVIPVAVMALVYISAIKVSFVTLVVAILTQVAGAYLSPRYVVKLPVKTIKRFVAAGLFIAAILILAGKFGLYPSGGEEIGLTGIKLVTLGILSFVYGALNNIGIGSYALTMATVYALGLSPAIAFPIMMGACTFSVPVGSIQFIKLDSYSRKITAFAATFGVAGVLIAAYAVKSMNVSALQWIVVVVILYSAVTTFMSTTKDQTVAKETE